LVGVSRVSRVSMVSRVIKVALFLRRLTSRSRRKHTPSSSLVLRIADAYLPSRLFSLFPRLTCKKG
jgi:hypothetical protein